MKDRPSDRSRSASFLQWRSMTAEMRRSLRLLAQQMTRVGDQLCHRVRLGRIVITTNVSVPIHQHNARAVHRHSSLFAPIRYRQLEPVTRQFVNHRLRPSEEIPSARFRLKSLRVGVQHFRRIFCRIDRERDKMHIGFRERFLQLAHPAADHWTRSRTGAENKIGDPDFAEQLRRTKRLTILIRELEYGNRAIGRNSASATPAPRYLAARATTA